ncbi:hypothetical protein GCM10022223_47610 [Kineosporia mesophila]|uniref:Uncharacterized protein n=1 Tax=Kineosporia mesophila TaxID=566012 RepID=A0ABP7A4Y0_9ACTN
MPPRLRVARPSRWIRDSGLSQQLRGVKVLSDQAKQEGPTPRARAVAAGVRAEPQHVDRGLEQGRAPRAGNCSRPPAG